MSDDLERLPTPELLAQINREDLKVPAIVGAALGQIAKAVDGAVARLGSGGHLHYFGAGTSGRLAVLDAAECPPTFGVAPELLVAHLAGGPRAFLKAVEGAEDSYEQGVADVRSARIGIADMVIGIAASGETPYVLGALRAARAAGALTAGIACVAQSSLASAADIGISLPVGPEVVEGSTRLKAGSAQKLVLNMISTATFAQLGHVHRGRMIDVRPTNLKLQRRAEAIVADLGGVAPAAAARALAAAGGSPKLAVLMARSGLKRGQAEDLLESNHGKLWLALGGTSGRAR